MAAVKGQSDTPTRDRLIAAALELFAEKGFKETTVGEIEAAAGLVPRRGGLYNHFDSKEALLRAAVQRHVEQIDEIAALLEGPAIEVELAAELTFLARWVIAEHRREEPLLAILQREGDRFPELRALISEHIVERGYREAVQWLQRKIDEGGFPNYDTEAVTVVALGSLVAYAAQTQQMGAPPLAVDEERFIAMWVEAWLRIASTAENERTS